MESLKSPLTILRRTIMLLLTKVDDDSASHGPYLPISNFGPKSVDSTPLVKLLIESCGQAYHSLDGQANQPKEASLATRRRIRIPRDVIEEETGRKPCYGRTKEDEKQDHNYERRKSMS